MANLTDADKILRNDTGKDIASKLNDILNTLSAGSSGLASNIIADEYDNTKTYAVGEYVIHSEGLYKCITAVSVAEEWTPAHWTQITVADELTEKTVIFDTEPTAGHGTGYTVTSAGIKVIADEVENIRIGADGKIYSSAGDAVRGQIGDILTVSIGKNLFDQTKAVAGFVQSNGTISTEGSYANYLTSDYVAINPSTNYVISDYLNKTTVQDTRKACLFYDIDKNIVPYSFVNQASGTELVINNANAYYVRFSFYGTHDGMIEQGNTRTSYAEYEKSYNLNSNFGLTDKMIEEIGTVVTDKLSGKKWIPCGDSFTNFTNASFADGIFAGKNKTYPRLIALRTGIVIDQKFFLDGRTLAYPADQSFANSLTNPNAEYYYQNIPADADYITIYLGINDSHHAPSSSGGDGEDNTGEIPLGTINDNTTATYYGAWNVVLTWLLENRPFAHIGIIISNGCDTVDYRNAQLAIAEKYGIPYIDMNGDERTPAMIRSQNPNVASAVKTIINRKQAVDYDGTQTGSVNMHPNYQTHEFESHFIESFLRSL